MPPIPPKGWRTRLFHWSHDMPRVGILALVIVLLSFGASFGIVSLWGHGQDAESPTAGLKQALDKATTAAEHRDRKLALVLQAATEELGEIATLLKIKVSTIDDFRKTGELSGVQMRDAIRAFAGPQDQQELFLAFVEARLDRKDERGAAGWKRIEAAALRLPPAPLANQFLGCLLEAVERQPEALQAFQREGELPEAKYARSQALWLAIKLKDQRALHELMAKPAYQKELTGAHEHQIGVIFGDFQMQIRGLVRQEWENFHYTILLPAVLCVLLWTAILLRFLHDVRHRWLWPIPMLLAGIASVIPTMWLIHHQEVTLGLTETGDVVHDLLYFIAGVGLREELSKLALFALFLPTLLRRRSASAALLAGAFVGLGFAFEENLGYYQNEGFDVVIGRLLTANFMHAAMTSIIGYSLYEMVRTKFHAADQFLMTFAAVVVMHGVYDWAAVAADNVQFLQGSGIVSIVLLALLAHRFFDSVGTYVAPKRGLVSLAALFVLGVACLVGLSMIMTAFASGSMTSVADIGSDATGLLPIGVLYLRRFSHT